MKSPILRFGKLTATYGLGQVIINFLGILMLPLLTRYLSPIEYGLISILEMVTFFLLPICGLGLGASLGIVYFENSSLEHRAQTVWTSVFLLAITSISMCGVGLIFAKEIGLMAFQTTKYTSLIQIQLLSLPFAACLQPLLLGFQFEELAKRFISLTGVAALVTGINTIIAVVVLGAGVRGFLWAALFSNFINLTLYGVNFAIRSPFQLKISLIRKLLKNGIPLIPSFFFIFIMQNSGRYILQDLRGLREVGIFTVGFGFGSYLSIAVTAFQNTWYPYFQSYFLKPTEGSNIFGRIFSYYLIVFGSLWLLLILLFKPLIQLLTDDAFHSSYTVASIVSGMPFFTGLSSMLLAGIYFAKKTHFISLVQLGSAASTLVVSLILIPRLGEVGAAIGITFGFMSMGAILFILNELKGFQIIHFENRRIISLSVWYLSILGMILLTEHFFSSQVYFALIPLFMALLVLANLKLLRPIERQGLVQFFLHPRAAKF